MARIKNLEARNISIHAPLRERREAAEQKFNQAVFQSTLPCGSDAHFLTTTHRQIYFNPRSLAGATMCSTVRLASFAISIHAPLRERHGCRECLAASLPISIHAPLRERLLDAHELLAVKAISIHAPLRERQHQKKILLFSFKSSIYCELAQLKYSKILF